MSESVCFGYFLRNFSTNSALSIAVAKVTSSLESEPNLEYELGKVNNFEQ